ncbi:MAG: hypothetical protein R3275_07645 [Saprospiraceae bacterium]|nr:hypothetical protein [Saprospiraceae bacterium]
MIRAAIDLGTNTFHLLVANIEDERISSILYQNRSYVFLAEEGLTRISNSALKRAESAVTSFHSVLQDLDVEDVRIIGTEALRTAVNGKALKDRIESILGHPVRIISGSEEALLIGQGVRLAMADRPISGHAIDIGGGSTEVISFVEGDIMDHTSQRCGIGYLYNCFHTTEPITQDHYDDMRRYIAESYSEYFSKWKNTKGKAITMIGVAGSFEALLEIRPELVANSGDHFHALPHSLVDDLLVKVRPLDLEGRKALDFIPENRQTYIIEALTIIDVLYKLMGASSIVVSEYSIKHGLLFR